MVRVKSVILSFSHGLYFTLTLMATLASVLTVLYTGTHLTAVDLFTVLTILSTLGDSINLQVQGARGLYDATVAIDRIQKYLLSDTLENTHERKPNGSRGKKGGKLKGIFNDKQKIAGYKNTEYSILTNMEYPYFQSYPTAQEIGEEPSITISQMSCGWFEEMHQMTLTNISLELKSSKLLIITGPVGSGKTSLLMAILQEIPIHEGSVLTQGEIAYVGQIPWVFTGTVRENILFGKPYEEDRYRRVLESCDLWQDIQRFPKGDMSMLGQRGVLLSGGQRTRVALARAVYSDSDIVLLDDPLSAVDAKVGQHIFRRCICGELAGKMKILVTHQLQHLHRADDIVVLKEGSIISQGSLKEVMQDHVTKETILLDAKDAFDMENVFEESYDSASVDDHHEEFRGADMEEVDEDKEAGKVSSTLYWEYLKYALPSVVLVILGIFSLIVQGNTRSLYKSRENMWEGGSRYCRSLHVTSSNHLG